MPYEWLPTAFAVLLARGITPLEVLQVLNSARRRPMPVRAPSGLVLLNIWARTEQNRPLIVTVHLTPGFDAEIVGARGMTDDEVKEFESWESDR